MKRVLFLFCILLLVSLSACAESSSAGSHRCDKKWGLCIWATVAPLLPGKPITVTTRVTSKNDIQNMLIVLDFYPAAIDLTAEAFASMEGTKKQATEIRDLTIQSGAIAGYTSIQANQPLSITWQLLAPVEWSGYYHLIARVFTPSGSPVTDSLRFYFTDEGGQVYYSGTQAAITLPPPVSTIYFYTYTPGPSPTWAPSATLYPQIATEVALTQQAATPPPPAP